MTSLFLPLADKLNERVLDKKNLRIAKRQQSIPDMFGWEKNKKLFKHLSVINDFSKFTMCFALFPN